MGNRTPEILAQKAGLFTACSYCSKKRYFNEALFVFFEQYEQPVNSLLSSVSTSSQAGPKWFKFLWSACELANTLRSGEEEYFILEKREK
jgi:hypothetical protein